MLERYTKVQIFITAMEDHSLDDLIPTASEITNFEVLVFMKELNEVTQNLQSEKTTMADVHKFFDFLSRNFQTWRRA